MSQIPRRRLEPVHDQEPGRGRVDVVSVVRRLPSGPSGVVAVILTLAAADALGVRVPGSGTASKILADPWVFFAIRIGVVVCILTAAFIAAWVLLSVASHIRNRRWIRRIAGFEPQALHQGAREVEDGHDEVRGAAVELLDENAELATALDRTTELASHLKRENEQLRRLLDAAPGQLQIDEQA